MAKKLESMRARPMGHWQLYKAYHVAS